MSEKLQKTIILCIEGCHGTGKTFICQMLKKEGYTVLDEGFIQKSSIPFNMHPQSFSMEHRWFSNWFNRIMSKCSFKKTQVFVCDRSPYSSVFYTRGGKGYLFVSIIEEIMKELKEKCNIHIYTACLFVKKEELWKRIIVRLKKEPFRKNYGEDSKEWMNKVCSGYNQFENWDLKIENNEKQTNHLKILCDFLNKKEKE